MPGWWRILGNKPWLGVLLCLGCAGSPRFVQMQEPAVSDFLARYERMFRPADFDPDIGPLLHEDLSLRHDTIGATALITLAVPETIPGFRLQVLLTQNIEEASGTRDTLNHLLPSEWVYTVYDAPYYKVRVGNFLDRASAGVLLKRLAGLGFKDAWTVPDNVIKNPPPKLPETFIVPEKPFDQKR